MYSDFYEPELMVTGKYRVIIWGSFAPNGTGQPTQPKGEDQYVKITRDGAAGLFLFTFAKAHDRLVSSWFTPRLNVAASVTHCIHGPVDLKVTKTLRVQSFTAGTAADIAAHANNRIDYGFVIADTHLTP
jgi:hypothetical protein